MRRKSAMRKINNNRAAESIQEPGRSVCVAVCGCMHVWVLWRKKQRYLCKEVSVLCVCLFNVAQSSFSTLSPFTGWKLNTNRWGGTAMSFGPYKF